MRGSSSSICTRWLISRIRCYKLLEQLPPDFQGLGNDYYLEEIYGYIHAYKNQGLFIGCNEKMLSGVSFYQTQLELYGLSYPMYPSRYSWFYKIPRRWWSFIYCFCFSWCRFLDKGQSNVSTMVTKWLLIRQLLIRQLLILKNSI